MKNSGSRHHARAGALILEMAGALAVCAMLIVLFQVSMVSMRRLADTAEAQNRGLVVLANVVERLEADTPVNVADAGRILSEEFEGSGFRGSRYYAPRCETSAEGLELSIVDPEGKALVAVRCGP